LEEWWSNSTSEGFNARQQCIAKQYSGMIFCDRRLQPEY
jgi:tRNA U38,U39,U40 pseudouridine synthase TruA